MTEHFNSIQVESIKIVQSSTTAVNLFRHLVAFIKKTTEIRCIQLIVVDPHSGDLQVKLYAYVPNMPMYDIAHKDGIIDSTVQTNEFICINSVAEDSVYDAYDDTIRSELAIPIALNGQVYGVLNLEHDTEHYFGNELVEAFLAVAEAISHRLPLLNDRHELEKERIV